MIFRGFFAKWSCRKKNGDAIKLCELIFNTRFLYDPETVWIKTTDCHLFLVINAIARFLYSCEPHVCGLVRRVRAILTKNSSVSRFCWWIVNHFKKLEQIQFHTTNHKNRQFISVLTLSFSCSQLRLCMFFFLSFAPHIYKTPSKTMAYNIFVSLLDCQRIFNTAFNSKFFLLGRFSSDFFPPLCRQLMTVPSSYLPFFLSLLPDFVQIFQFCLYSTKFIHIVSIWFDCY